MKKLFNLRLPVLYAAVLAAGIISAALSAYFGLGGAWLLLPPALTSLCGVALGTVKKKAPPVFILLSAALVFTVGAVCSFALIFSYAQTEVFTDGAVMIYGTVKECGVSSGGGRYIIIDGVSFGDTSVNGKLIAYFLEDAGEYCRRGYTVSFYSEPELLSFFSDGEVNYNAAKGVKYTCVIAGSLEAKYGFSLFGEIAYAVEELLYSNLDGETAAVSLAMLTGNSDLISSGTLAAFRNGGIAHVFAVSGLHIGVIYGAVTAVARKTALNKFASCALRIIFIVMFAGVCGFSPSSVRAVVMCSVSAVASCIYERYDSWNALSVSAIILLVIDPFYLFDAGFVLSFGAMLGIILLSHPLSSLFRFLPAKLRGSVAVGWSAQFATVPALMTTFGYVSWAGLFLNLVFIPVVSALYVLLFAVTLLCLIMPFAAPLLSVASVPVGLLINLITACGFENAVISGDFGLWLYLPFIAAAVAVSDKFNIKLRFRGAVASLSAVVLIFAATAPTYGRGTSVAFAAGYDGGYVILRNSCGSVLVASGDIDGVPQQICGEADALVIVGGDDGLSAMFNLDGSFRRVYLSGASPDISCSGGCEIVCSDAFTECGISFCYEGNSLVIEIDGVKMAVTAVEKGEPYGVMPQADFNLYCYGINPPVLYGGDRSYDLSRCGTVKYLFSCGETFPAFAAPKD